jgi:hypothetical protein
MLAIHKGNEIKKLIVQILVCNKKGLIKKTIYLMKKILYLNYKKYLLKDKKMKKIVIF